MAEPISSVPLKSISEPEQASVEERRIISTRAKVDFRKGKNPFPNSQPKQYAEVPEAQGKDAIRRLNERW